MHLGDSAWYDTQAWFVHACKEVGDNSVVVNVCGEVWERVLQNLVDQGPPVWLSLIMQE